MQVDLELAGGKRLWHLLGAKREAAAVDAVAVEVGAIAAQTQSALGSAELAVDDNDSRFEGFVANRQPDLFGPWENSQRSRGVFEQAFFGFGVFAFFFAGFVLFGPAAFALFFTFAAFFFFAFVGCFAFVFRFFFRFGLQDQIGGQAGRVKAEGVRGSGRGKQHQREQKQYEEKGQLAHPAPLIGAGGAFL